MDIIELKGKIVSKQVPSFLVFHGDEWEVQKIYINQISQSMTLPIKYIDSVSEILGTLKSTGLLSRQEFLYVVRDDKQLMTDEKVLSRVKNNLGRNILILLLTKLDKRLKFYTNNKHSIIIFDPLNAKVIKKYIEREIPLSDSNCDKLIEVCEGNYGRILLEVDKIKCYQQAYKKDLFPNDAFRILLEDGTIYTPPKDAIFDFVNAILDRNIQNVYKLYEDCKGVNESTLAILTNLFNNAKAVLQVQTCTSKDVGRTTGLVGWQIINARHHLDVYTNEELIYMLKLIQHCEQAIKTGQMEEKFVIDYILVRVL